ncbi:MAG: prolipoprotein diacylglyceryl transferase [Lachnospiraceae bacterium]|nr:prolipoprotein diacylglyceryl transferase [Lachnospiraceae bacterium]
MDMSINFPNLGIHLEHVGKNFSVFGFEIAFYGVVIAIGMILGVALSYKEAQRTKQNADNYLDLLIIAIFCAIIGARAYYVAFDWSTYQDDLLSIFNLRLGGLAIYGGLIAAVLAVFVYCKVKKWKFSLVADTCAMGILVGQICGRWGNFFNREAFGGYTDNLLAMQLPVSAVRKGEITQTMLDHLQTINGVDYIQVHPTFLYESLWNLAVLIVIFCYRKKKKFDGEVFLMYVAGYGAGRLWIEGLRTDQLLLTGTQIPVSQLLAGILLVVSVVWIILKRLQIRKKGNESIEETISGADRGPEEKSGGDPAVAESVHSGENEQSHDSEKE